MLKYMYKDKAGSKHSVMRNVFFSSRSYKIDLPDGWRGQQEILPEYSQYRKRYRLCSLRQARMIKLDGAVFEQMQQEA